MTSPVTSATSTTPTKAADPTGGLPSSSAMDKQAFLKLLVAQIQHQDPLSPMQGTEFVTQLSQFAIVEQGLAQTTRLDNLSTQLGGIANNDATSLVGKHVTVRGKGMAFDGLTATSSAVTLGDAAAKVTADILDSNGKVVRTINLGARPAGAVPVIWDGKTTAGEPAPQGNYTLKVNASKVDGSAVTTTQDVSGLVTKIAFDKGYPELTLDNGTTIPISDLVGVEAIPTKP
jgi:flagellar basal-body rod modification protein FlgD